MSVMFDNVWSHRDADDATPGREVNPADGFASEILAGQALDGVEAIKWR
jgi:hypothetical protein